MCSQRRGSDLIIVSGSSFNAHDVLFLLGMKNNFLLVSIMEDRGFPLSLGEGKYSYIQRELALTQL